MSTNIRHLLSRLGKVFTHNRIGLQSKFSTKSCLLNGHREATSTTQFDESMLEFVVCPLSKTQLRYDKENNELVCDEIQVAYPIINGIPNLIPQDARKLK
ncbi:protein preY, mitochondrial-like [Mytilus trossulus]|uniref:protein preY, mitochondrial-like n=1 Tax=Mytilus trossulus TaxID=6551 RepID=UPI0030060C6B